jgi:protein-disulfide isomerase/uncharacterized membrane protein
MKKTPIRLALIPLLSLVGVGSAVYLSQLYYAIQSGQAGFKSLCNVSATMNCNVVATSRWAEVFSGMPLSSLVAGWFIATLIIGLLARIDTWRKDAVTFGIWMSILGSVYSLFLIVVMAFFIKTLCPFCLVIDAINFVLLGLFLSLREGPVWGSLEPGRWKSFTSLIAACVFVMIVILKPVETKSDSLSKEEAASVSTSMVSGPVVEIKYSDLSPVIGAASAPITIVEFSDFQCPYCKQGASIVHAVQNRFGPDQVKIIFRPFPLDNSCNRMVKQSMHPYACELARAAFCSGKQGKFKEVYEEIFENQDILQATSGVKIPTSQGVNEAELKICMASEEAKKFVADEIEEGVRLDVQSTPTFFINGRKVEGGASLEAWNIAVEKILAGQK